MIPHNTRDDRHQHTIQQMVEQNYTSLKKAMSGKNKTDGKRELHELIETALSHGINFALNSEDAAWQRTTELEDIIIGIVKHAPESDLLRARKLTQQVEAA